MNQLELIKLILHFVEKNQIISMYIIAMAVMCFALFAIMRIAQKH